MNSVKNPTICSYNETGISYAGIKRLRMDKRVDLTKRRASVVLQRGQNRLRFESVNHFLDFKRNLLQFLGCFVNLFGPGV